MTIRTLITMLALVLCCSLNAQSRAERAGQRAKDRAQNRAENKVQNKADRTVDKAVDDAFNAVGNLFKKKKKKSASTAKENNKPTNTKSGNRNDDDTADEGEAAAANLINQLMGGGEWEAYTNPQTFSITMTSTEVKRNGKTRDNTIDVAVTTDRFAMHMSEKGPERTQMILNTQDGYTTMISTTKKGETSGIQMRMPRAKVDVAEIQAETVGRHTYERTGERRTIDGYNCEKIIVTDTKTNNVTEGWLTQDIPLTTMDVFGGMARAFGARAPQMEAAQIPFEGFPIESVMTEPNGTKTTIKFSDIKIGEANYDRSLLDTGDVEIQRVGGF